MILLIDTTANGNGNQIVSELENNYPEKRFEYIDTREKKISHCLGCNFCWLKTPGECVVKDDYEEILKKMSKADQVWLITDTSFGSVTYKAKNILDRVMPLVTMNLHMVGKQMRHVLRYDKNPDWGMIYCGEGDREYLSLLCERVAINFAGKSVGVYPIEEYKEAITCM